MPHYAGSPCPGGTEPGSALIEPALVSTLTQPTITVLYRVPLLALHVHVRLCSEAPQFFSHRVLVGLIYLIGGSLCDKGPATYVFTYYGR